MTDHEALIRGGRPDFAASGETIPAGTFVLVAERAEKGGKSFVKVSRAEIRRQQQMLQLL